MKRSYSLNIPQGEIQMRALDIGLDQQGVFCFRCFLLYLVHSNYSGAVAAFFSCPQPCYYSGVSMLEKVIPPPPHLHIFSSHSCSCPMMHERLYICVFSSPGPCSQRGACYRSSDQDTFRKRGCGDEQGNVFCFPVFMASWGRVLGLKGCVWLKYL